MKSSGRPRGSASRFKLLMYEQQMIKMINYKSTGIYPFDPMDVNKKGLFVNQQKIIPILMVYSKLSMS